MGRPHVAPYFAAAAVLAGLIVGPAAFAAPTSNGPAVTTGGTVGHVAVVTKNNEVDVVVVRASGKTLGETKIGPATTAPANRLIAIYDFSASGDGNWLAWQEVVTKPNGFVTAAKPTLVLRDLGSSQLYEIKTDDYPIGFAGDSLITYGAHTSEVDLQPTPHLSRLPGREYPQAAYPNGTVNVDPLRQPSGPKDTERLQLTTLGGKSTVLHDYVLGPQNPRLPETSYVSGDGQELVVERGDHTDFGGIGPSSLTDEYSLSGNHTRTTLGHYGTAKAAWRIGDVSFAYKSDDPWALWERAAGNGADSVIAVYEHGEWREILPHGIAVAANRDGYVIAQAGKYVFDSNGIGVTRVPTGDALLIHGTTTKVMGISGSEFAWVS